MANRINLGAVKGETGATGATGLTGANGQDGITPHIENGYWYIGSTNQNVKAKGDTWYKGTGAPTDEGVNGDYYIDTATNDVYNKQNNVWSLATNIKGAQGEQGEQGENATSISIGTVTSLPNGEPATAELVALGNGAYQLNLGIPEGAQGEQGIQGRDGNTTAYVGGFAVNTLNFDSDPQAQIDSKLNSNLGSGNAGKILSVDSSGNIIATSSTAEDDVIDAYIVGSTDFAYDWLSLTAGGEPLTATQGKIYVVRSSGDYYLLQFVWNGTAYEQTGGGDTSGLASKTEAVGSIVLSIDSSTYVVTLQAKDVNGTNIGTAQTIDLPIESVLVDVDYDTTTKELILTLQNGNNVRVDISDIISGLQKQIQYSTMPTASESNVGAIIQYTGADTSNYISGHFYKCIDDTGTYRWEEIEFGGSAPENMVTTNTSQYITGTKTFLKQVKISTAQGSDNTIINPTYTALSSVLGTSASSPYYYVIGDGTGGFTGIALTSYGMFNTQRYSFNADKVVSGLGYTPNSAKTDWGFYRKNPANAMKQVVNFNKITMFDTGDNIITRVTNSELIDNQVIVCIANSTDANVTYLEKHTYKFNYANNTWTATDITPSGSAPSNMVTTDTLQTINVIKYFTQKLIAGGGTAYYLGQSGTDGWSFGQLTTTQDNMLYLLKEVVSTREPADRIWGTHIDASNGHIYTARTSNNEDYWADITPFKKEVLTNTTASTWVADSTYAGYGYKCELSVSGVTANDLAEVTFGVAEATSGNYAPVVETSTDTITIYSKVNTSITIPTIKVEKL